MKLISITLARVATRLMTALFTIAIFAACTKEKKPLPQHSGQGLNGIYKLNPQEVDGRTFVLQTGAAKRIENTTVADSTDITVERFKTASYPFVEYTIPKEIEDLLGYFEFIGRTNHTYQMRIELDDESLWVYAVAPKSDISSQHSHVVIPTGVKNKDGRELHKVPVMGIPVTYMFVEIIKDAHGKPTSRTTEYVVLRKNMANHVQLNHHLKSQFKYLEKLDVYPSDLFQGDWYFAETIVATIAGEEGAQGFHLAATDTTLAESTKIRFIRAEDKIRGININIDDRVDEADEVNFQTVIEMPVQWKEYRIMREGNTLAFEEEEIPDVNWRDKKFGKFNFNEILTASLGAQINNTALAERKLVEIEIKENYRSYTIFLPRHNIRVRHSFMRAEKNHYEPKRAHKDDMKKFGYFTTTKKVLNTFELERIEDLEKLRFINRFDTSKGEIVFHFTKTSPPHLRVVGEMAIDEWNKTFKAAGTGVEIKLSDEDVNLGDLRYNAINIIESLAGGGSGFGFGPSITDPQTGEIISATANVWSTPIRDAIISFLRNYVRSQIGLVDDKYLFAMGGMSLPSLKMMASGQHVSQGMLSRMGIAPMDIESFRKIFNTIPELGEMGIVNSENKAEYIFNKSREYNTHYERKMLNKAIEKNGKVANWDPLFMRNFGREFSLGFTHANLIEELLASKECDPLQDYIKGLQDTNQFVGDREHEVLLLCANKLLIKKMLGTLVHELGHNFGLRHNFMGSNDVANFMFTEDTGTRKVVESSTAMEYPSFGMDRLTKPGKYDLAAIRFGYADAVEAKDGNLVALNTDQPIHVNMAEKGLERKPYKFCTDEHSARYAGSIFSQYTNPMCNQWDKGTTAKEVMDFIAAEYSVHIALQNHRLQRIWPPSNFNLLDWGFINAISRLRYLRMAKLFYDHWRVELAHFLALGEEYLEKLTFEEFQEVLQKMAQSERINSDGRKYKDLFAEFKPAANTAFTMLMDIVFMPNRYCATKKADGDFDITELEELRQQAYWNRDRAIVTSCDDPMVQQILSEGNKGQIFFEVGYYLNDLKFDMNPAEEIEPLDITGTLWDRLFAISILGQRSALSGFHRSRSFFPNFFDEPDKQGEIVNRVLDRVLRGVSPLDLKKTPINSDILQQVKDQFANLPVETVNAMVDDQIRNILARQGLSPEKIEEQLTELKANQAQYKSIKNGLITEYGEQQVLAFLQNKRFIQFKHEKDLLSFFYNTLPRSLMIPGKSAVNSRRQILFSMSITDQPEVIQQAAAKVPIGGGRFIVTSESSRIAVKVINQLAAISNLKRLTFVDPETPIVKNTLALYDVLGSETMTFDDYSAFIILLKEVISQSAFGIQVQLAEQFGLDLAIFDYLESLEETERIKIVNKDDMRVTYANVAAKVGQPMFPFNLIQSDEVRAFFDNLVPNNNAQFLMYMDDKDDYEAQEDILSGIVFSTQNSG